MLTERQYIGQTLPKLSSRTSDRASTSRTRPSNPRTWSCLKPWPEFKNSVQQMHAKLDDVNPRFAPMVGGDPLSAPLHVIGQSPGGLHAGWYIPPPPLRPTLPSKKELCAYVWAGFVPPSQCQTPYQPMRPHSVTRTTPLCLRSARQVVPNVETDDDGTIMFGLTAASEDDVKALLHLQVLQGVTQVARHRNLGKGNPWWPAAY